MRFSKYDKSYYTDADVYLCVFNTGSKYRKTPKSYTYNERRRPTHKLLIAYNDTLHRDKGGTPIHYRRTSRKYSPSSSSSRLKRVLCALLKADDAAAARLDCISRVTQRTCRSGAGRSTVEH